MVNILPSRYKKSKKGGVTGFKWKINIFVLVSLLFLAFISGLVGYSIYKVRKFQIEPLGEFEIANIEKREYISWVFILTDKRDISQAKIEEICFYFFSHHSLEVYTTCMSGEKVLEDRTRFTSDRMVKVEDYFIDTNLTSKENLLIDSIDRLEEIVALNFDRVTIIPSEAITTEFAALGLSKDTSLENMIERLTKISLLEFLFKSKQLRDLGNSVYGNFNKRDFLDLQKYTREYEGTQYDLEFTNMNINKKEISNFVAYNAWDDFFNRFNLYDDISFEQVQVEVLNASSVSGYANYIGRWFEHVSIRVIRVDNAPGEISSTCERNAVYIRGGVSQYPRTYAVISEILEKDGLDNIQIHSERPTFVSTGDIVVLLCGQD